MNKCDEKINKDTSTLIVDNEFLDQSCNDCVAGSDVGFSITTPTSGVFDEFISLLPATAPYTITPIDISNWCNYDIATDGMRVYGTSVTGTEKQIFSITNDCDEFHVVVTITTPSSCIAPSNITKNVTSNKGSLSAQVTLLADSTLVSSSLPDGVVIQVVGDILYFSGSISTQNPYSVALSTPCGNYTISGDILICKQIAVLSTSGTTVFEKDAAAGFTWNLNGNIEIESVDKLPNGLGVSVSGQSVVIIGTPSENTGGGTISVKVKNSCSTLDLKVKYTEAPCKVITVVGDIGSSVIKTNVAASFGKILGGKTPIELVNYEGVPKGMAVSVVENGGVYSIVISGTPTADPCATSDTGNVCESALITVKNECGEKEIEMPYSLNTVASPVYCIGVYEWIDNGGTGTLNIYGIVPNSTVTITGADSPNTMTVDAYGNGSVEVNKSGITCPTISHTSCAFIQKKAVSVCATPFINNSGD